MSFFVTYKRHIKQNPKSWMIRGYGVRSFENRSRITEVARRPATLCIEETKRITHLYYYGDWDATNNIRQNVTNRYYALHIKKLQNGLEISKYRHNCKRSSKQLFYIS